MTSPSSWDPSAAIAIASGAASLPPVEDPEAAAELEVVLHELADRMEFRGAGSSWTVDLVTALPGSVVEAMAGAGTPSELHIAVVEGAVVEPSSGDADAGH